MGEPTVEIRLLGPLEIRVDDRVVPVGRPMQRSLLAALALEPGSCVSRGRLLDALWGEHAPESAGHALQVHVSSLRKLLGAALVETCPGGYRLAVAPGAVDAVRAEELAAAGACAEALSLFRGEPLADVTLEGQLAHEARRLGDLRLDLLERNFEARLAGGGGAELVPGLERLVAENPLRERPHAQLMLALYRAGRQADALAAYQHARRTFVEELGLEPSRAIRDLEAAILAQDESLVAVSSPAEAEKPRSRRTVLIAATVLALVATGAGVATSYVLPPDRSHAATPPPSTGRPAIAVVRTTTVSAPVRHVAPRPARRRHHVARTTPTMTTTARVSRPERAQPAPTTTAPVTTEPASPRITTHPTRTTPPPPPPPPTTTAKPSGPVHLVDTFDSQVVDGSTWNVLINGIGGDAVQRDGKLVISLAAGAKPGGSYNFVGVQYGTKECFSGDLDMQVDYKLDEWPAESGAYVSLQAVFANAMVERFAPQQGSDVIGSIIDPRFASAAFDGTSGSLRLTRVGGVATTYYLLDGAWQAVDSAPAPHPAHLHIGLSMVPATSPPAEVVVELDNFSATASGPTTC